MKKLLVLILFAVCNTAIAESVTLTSIDYVYELDADNSFDFAGGANHTCEDGTSNVYRISSNSQESVNRKFSMLLMALASGNTVIVNAGACAGDRRMVGWVRIYK